MPRGYVTVVAHDSVRTLNVVRSKCTVGPYKISCTAVGVQHCKYTKIGVPQNIIQNIIQNIVRMKRIYRGDYSISVRFNWLKEFGFTFSRYVYSESTRTVFACALAFRAAARQSRWHKFVVKFETG